MPTSTTLSMNVPNLLADLNPVQHESVKAADGLTLILAGAGSGKTKALTHEAAYLVKEKGAQPRIFW